MNKINYLATFIFYLLYNYNFFSNLNKSIKIMLDNNLNNMNQQLNKLNIYTNKQNNF